MASNTIPTTAPTTDPTIRVSMACCHPKKAPTMAKNLISPPPMPSFPNKKGLTHARASKNPPPTNRPTSELTQPVGNRKDAHKKPTTIPGNVITSGMILWSQSIQATTRNTDTNPAYTIVGHVSPNRQTTRR